MAKLLPHLMPLTLHFYGQPAKLCQDPGISHSLHLRGSNYPHLSRDTPCRQRPGGQEGAQNSVAHPCTEDDQAHTQLNEQKWCPGVEGCEPSVPFITCETTAGELCPLWSLQKTLTLWRHQDGHGAGAHEVRRKSFTYPREEGVKGESHFFNLPT